eukprot:9199993-Alexandrium_andersonii.AAC.1
MLLGVNRYIVLRNLYSHLAFGRCAFNKRYQRGIYAVAGRTARAPSMAHAHFDSFARRSTARADASACANACSGCFHRSRRPDEGDRRGKKLTNVSGFCPAGANCRRLPRMQAP